MHELINIEGIELVLANKNLNLNLDKPMLARKPKGFREGFDGELACPHRNISTCAECAVKYANIYEVYEQHFWFRDLDEMVWTIKEFVKTENQRLAKAGA